MYVTGGVGSVQHGGYATLTNASLPAEGDEEEGENDHEGINLPRLPCKWQYCLISLAVALILVTIVGVLTFWRVSYHRRAQLCVRDYFFLRPASIHTLTCLSN